jgi:hypothetical protein
MAQDKDGMLRRALERIIQLYTDKSHFVYELLQNAEDAEAKSIRFIQYDDRLEVLHDGKPFTSANLQGLCDIGKSDKVDNLNQIGEFGVGFKSVFGICDTVRLYSEPSHFLGRCEEGVVPFAVEIKDFTRPEDIPEEAMPKSYTTRFVFPFAVGHTYSGFTTVSKLSDTLSRKLQNLGITTLLFMKHLELIEYEIKTGEETIAGEYLLEKEVINEHCSLVSALGISEKGPADADSEEMISYLKFSKKLERYPLRTVDIAFPVKTEGSEYQCIKAPNPYVSVYFPTETESKLDFIVQGPFRTTPNRSSIPADDTDNIYLAEETALLLRDSLLELKEAGALNMSFVKALPIDEDRFYAFGLFAPLYDTVKDLFSNAAIIPSKDGKYVYAKYSRIARQERLATVFSDELLSQLINDGRKYCWLPTYLTETNREYNQVLDYMTSELDIPVVRPEDLRSYFTSNPKFLPAQSNDWLVELYSIFENIPGAFSKSRYEANMATADIVKTSSGTFVAPFRREEKTYIPNVFLPFDKIRYADINFVDAEIYKRCRHFFDDILQLQKPNEYEFIIKDIKKRYESGNICDDSQHAEDIKALLKYSKREEYEEEVNHVIREFLALRCTDSKMRSCYASRIFFPISTDGINIESYYKNISKTAYFVDVDFYTNHGIDVTMLKILGVKDSIIVGDNIQSGTYDTGTSGRKPEWRTYGDFRWKFSIDILKDALRYISAHPTAKDSMLKSQAIMKVLTSHENQLCGSVYISGIIPNKENEPCEMIHILRGERTLNWDGKWLYTESLELVAPKEISRHDISADIYGRLKMDSAIFDLIGFKRTDADEVDELKKTIPQEKLEAFFESELRQRYGISSSDLEERYGSSYRYEVPAEEEKLPFPSSQVRSWDALRKHAAEMLIYADPVRYEEKIRSIRVSNHQREAKAYLSNMYRYDGNNRYKFACQLCHETCSSFETAELFLRPETELDPMNLCLCPNCAATYRKLRASTETMDSVRRAFLTAKDTDIINEDYVAILIDDEAELWFTQTHFAEIRELIKLSDEVKEAKKNQTIQPILEGEGDKSGMSVYSGYIGKTITRSDGFVGTVTNIITSNGSTYVEVNVTGGKNAGKETKIDLSFILKNRRVYTVLD